MCYEKRDTEQARACFERDQRGEKMAEYIEREAFLSDTTQRYCINCDSYNGVRCRACWVNDMQGEVDDFPAADVQTVVHSHWVHDSNNLYGCYRCMERETMSPKKLKPYCPNCGARVDGE